LKRSPSGRRIGSSGVSDARASPWSPQTVGFETTKRRFGRSSAPIAASSRRLIPPPISTM
jgi:hypothetical protein